MAISAEEKYLLNNKAGRVANKVQLGTLIENAESVTAGEIALANGKVLVGNGSGVGAAVDLSGAITVANTGVTTLGADVVTNAKIADGAVSLEHLDSGVAPSHVVKYAGSFTTLGGDASESISVSGVVDTDIVVVTVKTAGGTPRSVVAAAAGTDAIAVTLSGDPSTDHVLHYVVYRAAA